jgi:hypothetical protein
MISPEELAVLADLYARSAHNLDPFSPDARQANVEFLRKVDELYEREDLQSVSKSDFKVGLIRRCKAFLRRNDPRLGL